MLKLNAAMKCKLKIAKPNISNGDLYPLDGVTNLKYKLLYFLTPNKKYLRERHWLLTGIDDAI